MLMHPNHYDDEFRYTVTMEDLYEYVLERLIFVDFSDMVRRLKVFHDHVESLFDSRRLCQTAVMQLHSRNFSCLARSDSCLEEGVALLS